MEIQQTATPPGSSPAVGMTIQPAIRQAESTFNRFDSTSPVSKMGNFEKAKQTSKPLPFDLDHDSQIKLIDVCTEKQGTYFKCKDLSEFWAEVAHSLDREFPFPITGRDVEGWVEKICRPTKEYLLRREIFPHRADCEDLDIAIEDWLEIEGRRKFQSGFSEMITGYLLALRENTDRVKLAVGMAPCSYTKSNYSHQSRAQSQDRKCYHMKSSVVVAVLMRIYSQRSILI
ncbi:hypothetical protein F4806DRAFT_336659 [Annulohypoxylon nitens]|nr:hypothetical protein F4806DRAFT_336659 [Annulohypoxylon nitens]